MPNPISQENLQSVVDIMKTIGENAVDDVLAPFKTKARWAARRLGPFFNMRNALVAGLPEEGIEISDEQKADFKHVMALHPDFPHLIANFQGESDAYENFIDMMVTLMGRARSDDTHLCKIHIKEWLPANPAQDALSAPIVGARKDNRGFFHRDTARALTPLRLIAQFDANPQVFMVKVQNGTILMTAKEYPSFLYPAGTVYNREDPAAAPKDLQAEINGMTEVFPEAVAVTAVHVHFSLSDVATWADIDRSPFRYYNFYLKCMQLFADPDDEWVKETLEFLTSQIPSLKRRKRARALEEEEGEHDDIEDETAIILS
ncbi:hypothetical protein CPB84DRAFT_1855196 [Gymnopilus junonius]|uniref:Uncharacterized protein n=1 Tax=Gymnopilus junonius TaxID=109634 RepID=A0A9P5N7Z7_GYMJU|nr:hypothetical protein CPB84DRAFT_1855196 [Gymnopilus junonius]